MPYLTSTKAGPASTGVRPGIGVPGYAHPLVAPTEWSLLTRPGTPLDWVVLNVADGPGAQPDPHCLEAGGRLRNARVRVLGHLDAAHVFGDMADEARRYLDWYQVDGFLLGRCPAGPGALPDIRRAVTTLRALRGGAHIVLGHGSHPHPRYAEIADQLVTFHGPWSDYRWSQVAEWTADHPPERFCHLVYGLPLPHLDEALRIARWQGAGTIFFTDRTCGTEARVGGLTGARADAGSGTSARAAAAPFETLPGYWDDIVSRVGTGVSE